MVSAGEKLPSTTTAEAPAVTTPPTDVAEVPAAGDDKAIGTTDDDDAAAATPGDDDVAVAGPIGSDSSYENYPPPQQTSGSCVTCTIGLAIISAATVGSVFLIF
ncbi:hypothetical protein N665_0214s0061 [Sinapis alba]|nr:hypothetical protein N665_0214s0061 [Sinapis alba]